MSGKVIRTLFLIFFLLLVMVQSVPNNVTAIGEPEVSLKFDDGGNVQEASVGPGDPHAVRFQGSVSVHESAVSNVQSVHVKLESSSDQGWELVIHPDEFYINPGNSDDFELTVRVPFGTSSEIEDTITVTGFAENYPSGSGGIEIPPIYGTIKIKPYYQVTLRPITNHIKTSPGSEVTFVLLIENNGNAINRFSIELENNDELDEKGYEFELSDSTIVIPEKENKTIEVTVIIPEHLTQLNEHKGYAIRITIISEGQTFDERDHRIWEFYLEVYQKDIYLTYEFVISIIIIIAIVISVIIIKRFRKSKRKTKK